MRYLTLRLAVILIISMIITTVWSGTGSSQLYQEILSLPAPPEVPIVPPAVPPEGWITFDENYLTLLQNEPEKHFHEAREKYFKKEMESAATDIRKAAVFLAMESARSTYEGKKLLMVSVEELGELAGKVEKGNVTPVNLLDYAFARAHLTLAMHHYLKAKELWAKKNAKNNSHDLLAATLHLENFLTWSGRKLEDKTAAAIKEVRFITGKNIEREGWILEEKGKTIEHKETGKVSKDFGEAIVKIGEEIVRLGRVIEPEIE